MDGGRVVGRAWEITWRWKVLWLPGLLAGLGTGGGGAGNFSPYIGDESGAWYGQAPSPAVIVWITGLITAVVCLLLIVGIAIWVVSLIARGGFVAGVQQVEDEGATSFSQAWKVGRKRFWTLLGLGILALIPILVLSILGVAILVAVVLGAASASEPSAAAGGTGIAAAILCGGAFCCSVILLTFVLEQIRIDAERAAILDDLGWIDALKRGWQVLNDNLGPTIIMWIVFLVLGFILVTIVFAGFALLAVPFIAMIGRVEPGVWLVAAACCGGLLLVVVIALLSSIPTTFSSAGWTLAYRELSGYQLAPMEDATAQS